MNLFTAILLFSMGFLIGWVARVAIVRAQRSIKLAEQERDKPTGIRDDIAKILEGFDKGVLVRDISLDNEPGWALHVLPYIAAIGRLQAWVDYVYSEDTEAAHAEYEKACRRLHSSMADGD